MKDTKKRYPDVHLTHQNPYWMMGQVATSHDLGMGQFVGYLNSVKDWE
ncbi:MAG: hypothetical protein FWF59_14915 [Turicibacter sp.]|nr:hypothetical protein [Turicibacter sp.]